MVPLIMLRVFVEGQTNGPEEGEIIEDNTGRPFPIETYVEVTKSM